jgi:hypothetical protein
MRQQHIGLLLRFIKKIPGIIPAIIVKKNPSIEAAHEYSEKYHSGRVINGERENFPTDNKMQEQCSGKQVKEKQKVSKHGNFT